VLAACSIICGVLYHLQRIKCSSRGGCNAAPPIVCYVASVVVAIVVVVGLLLLLLLFMVETPRLAAGEAVHPCSHGEPIERLATCTELAGRTAPRSTALIILQSCPDLLLGKYNHSLDGPVSLLVSL